MMFRKACQLKRSLLSQLLAFVRTLLLLFNFCGEVDFTFATLLLRKSRLYFATLPPQE